ncbi:MAG TPA: BON domain-containing protein [Candidatus Angelobacter sp.]|nr:BON domain-containing protein [Candidatus Angelobacter sp.]
MIRIIVCALLLLATPAIVAQQQPQSPPPYTTPPTFPDNNPQTQKPPVLPEQQSQAGEMSSSDIQQQLQQSIAEDPTLSDAKVETKVDDQSIILTGMVQNETQHRKILATVEPYAGKRKIVDKLMVKKTA